MYTHTNVLLFLRENTPAVLTGAAGVVLGILLWLSPLQSPQASLVAIEESQTLFNCAAQSILNPFCEASKASRPPVKRLEPMHKAVVEPLLLQPASPPPTANLRPSAPVEQSAPEILLDAPSAPKQETSNEQRLPVRRVLPKPDGEGGSTMAKEGATEHIELFPKFDHASFPVSRVPNWGAMTSAEEWDRPYKELTSADVVRVPTYNLRTLTTPLSNLVNEREKPYIEAKITEKLFYSTRFFGRYDLDAGEFTGNHPGMDLKLALGTPIGSIAGGRVAQVSSSFALGTFVIIEHRHKTDGTFYSIYGHLGSVSVREGQDVTPGQTIGAVGLTGNTSSPHLHLQIDRGEPGEEHVPYTVEGIPSRAEAEAHTVHPIEFLAKY